ncbi:MAG TPA: TetR/AcrR family transcriptional regulator [Thermoanaerobaculia bacterium]|jgi:AcrR family transcriptional regulator|nr:TetR/AcrR family transcriptional regulator [Thermoanaerobaculia bacterium]
MKNPNPQVDGRAAEVYRTAAKLILQKGYDATSVGDIADALGITKAGLYHYIRGKTELLYDIMKYGLEELEREVMVPARAIADAGERLRFVIAMHAQIVTRGDGAVTILVDEARALSAAQYRHVTKLKRAYVDFLRETMEELRAAGKLRDVNTTVGAFSIIAAVNWLSRWYQPEGALTANEIAEQITDVALNGVLRPEGPRRVK